MSQTEIPDLLAEIRQCQHCAQALPLGPRPVLQTGGAAKIAVCGQAPGIRVHRSGKPFDDPSGDRLRAWLGVTPEQFYDPACFHIIPMGFCYPGTLPKKGDLPPRPECKALWHDRLFAALDGIALKLVIGQYALDYHVGERREKTLTATIQNWQDFIDDGILPMPHPSPRNNLWLRRNPWFEAEIIPWLQAQAKRLLQAR